jgi:GntR family transcriptional regulator, phosphonate transport system regulatory protein
VRRPGTLIWREIEEALSSDIAAGIYPAGGRLPVENDLASRFGVNRHTVRQALAALQERGAISIEQGRGMFVKAPKLAYPIGRRTRFTENVGHLPRTAPGQLVRHWRAAAPPPIARDLELRRGAPLVAFDVLRIIDDEPVSITTHYFPAQRFETISDAFVKSGSVTSALAQFGVADYARRLTRAHARGATLEEASLLKCESGGPVLVVEAVNVDPAGVPIEVGHSRSAGGRWELIFESARS